MCLRYEKDRGLQFLHEAEMLTVLRHKTILTLHGVIIASSYSPSVALVSSNFFTESPDSLSSIHFIKLFQLCPNAVFYVFSCWFFS